MPQIAHPDGEGMIEVEVLQTESHHGTYHQVKAVDDSIELSDPSGESPWVTDDELQED